MILEGIILFDFYLTINKSWMDIKFEFVPIHEKVPFHEGVELIARIRSQRVSLEDSLFLLHRAALK